MEIVGTLELVGEVLEVRAVLEVVIGAVKLDEDETTVGASDCDEVDVAVGDGGVVGNGLGGMNDVDDDNTGLLDDVG